MSLYFTEDHEWIAVEGKTGTVGITDHEQEHLGDITFIELPETGSDFGKGDSVAVVDSVKAASDVYTPVSGAITEVNSALEDEPELVNNDAEGDGWLFKLTLSDPSELEGLMDEDAYKKFVESL